jgi:hypothetical protein
MRAAKRSRLRVGIQLEHLPGRGTVASIGADIAYLRSLGIRDIYRYRSNDFAAEDWCR